MNDDDKKKSNDEINVEYDSQELTKKQQYNKIKNNK